MLELKKEEAPLFTAYIHLLGSEIEYIVLNSEDVEEVVQKRTIKTISTNILFSCLVRDCNF